METIQKYGEVDPKIIESLVLHGDISKMDSKQKVTYYDWLCKTLGLNPSTQPFQIIKFQGKEILYAKKDATEQLRKIYGVSVIELDKLFHEGIYIVTAKLQDKNGRYDVATGAVSIKNLSGDNLANALMKAETKAKRRGTLSICGLGILDESETDTIGKYEEVQITQIKEDIENPKELTTSKEITPPASSNEATELNKEASDMSKPELDPDILERIKTAKTQIELKNIWFELSDENRPKYQEVLSTRKAILKANKAA
jgi:hypothetical protein